MMQQDIPSSTDVLCVTAATTPLGYALHLQRRDIPALQPHQVLIAVQAAGVNRPDIMQAKGGYPPPATVQMPWPEVLGLEVAGIIIAKGSAVGSQWHIGDAVCALVAGSGYARHTIADAHCLLPIVPTLSVIEAAALPETYFTVYSNFLLEEWLPSKAAVLVQGGSGGIGTTAIQLLKHLKQAFVFATAGNAEKQQQLQAIGADVAIDYTQQDFAAVIREHPLYNRVAAVLDIVGSSTYTQKHFSILQQHGRLVQLAFQQGSKMQVDMLPLLLKRLTWTGSTLRSAPLAFKEKVRQGVQKDVLPLLALGKCKPIVYESISWRQATAAHAALEKGLVFGKLVLKID